jgi:hypothetical protein
MSTKTTFKRVALVTVAALGFGLLSVAPSSAITQTDTLAVSASASTCVIGTACTITLTQTMLATGGDTMSVTARMTTSPAGSAALPTLVNLPGLRTGANASATTIASGVNAVQGGGLIGLMADTRNQGTYGSTTAAYTVSFTATTRGTHVVTFTAANSSDNIGTATNTPAVAAAVTWTITVAAGTVADNTTTSVRSVGIVASGSTADQSVIVPINTGSAVANVVVTPLTAAAASTGSTTAVYTMTGPGNIMVGASPNYATSARTVTVTQVAAQTMYLFGDGTSGTTVVTITIGTVVLTETFTFYGAAASVTSTLVTPVIQSGSGAAATTGVITATVKDANGNVVPGVSLFAVSASGSAMASSTATSGSTGIASFSFTGLTAGTSAITVQNVAAGSTVVYSAAALTVRAGDSVGASAVIRLDKETYAQGEVATVTVTVKDAAGNLVANGSNTPFAAAAVCSRACTGTLPGTTHVTSGSHDGAITYTINVPSTSGAFTVSATAGSGWTGTFSAAATVSPSAAETAAVAAAAANAAATAAAIAAAADIASAAVDAAAEATDAANAATDAANAAAEAADAATAAAQDAADAVASLATAVTELMADLKAQIAAQKAAITALTNLVIKIQKKIKA